MSSEDHVRSKQTSNSSVTCNTQAFCRPLLPAVLLRCENNNFSLLISECGFLALPSELFPHDLRPSFYLVHKDQRGRTRRWTANLARFAPGRENGNCRVTV